MSLWRSQYAAGIKDLLQGLDTASLRALANTACCGRLAGVSSNEDVDIILRYTHGLDTFFSYEILTPQFLSGYLCWKKQAVNVDTNRPRLMQKILEVWESEVGVKQEGNNVSLKESQFASHITDLLCCLYEGNLRTLANTVCQNRIMGTTYEDDVDIILHYTETLDKLFSYVELTAEVLRGYLEGEGLPVSAGETRAQLLHRVKYKWGAAALPSEDRCTPPESSLSPQCPTPPDIRRDRAEQHSHRSADQYMKGKYNEALADAREAVRLDKSMIEGYVFVAKCNIALGDPTAALSVLREATDLDKGRRAVKDEIVRAQCLIICQEEIEKAFSKEDYSTAIIHLERALGLAEGCKALKTKKAECLVMLQKYTEAEEMINEIAKLDNNDVDAIYVEGIYWYYSQDDMEEALNRFHYMLRLAPDHTKARELYKKVKQLKQKREEGNEAFSQGRYQKTIALYTEALTIDPLNRLTNAKLYFDRATVIAKLRNWRPAMEDCTAAIKLDGGYLKAYLQRARCYQELGRHEEAVRDYEMVVRLDNNDEHRRLLQGAKTQLIAYTHSNRSGNMKREHEEYDFLADAEKCVKFDPGHCSSQ